MSDEMEKQVQFAAEWERFASGHWVEEQPETDGYGKFLVTNEGGPHGTGWWLIELEYIDDKWVDVNEEDGEINHQIKWWWSETVPILTEYLPKTPDAQ